MKIALISPPLEAGIKSDNSLFRFLHDCAKARPFWNKPLRKFTRKMKFLDFEDYPNGLVQLATILKQKHEVKIFNFMEKDYLAEIIEFRPDIAGFTCPGGGNLVWTDVMSRLLKSKIGSIIFLGGTHVSLTPTQSLQTTIADFIFIGESDFVILDVIDYIEGKKPNLPDEGVCYRKNGKIIETLPAIIEDLSKLPIPDHSLLDLNKYKAVHIETSRGCPNRCSFCFLAGYKKKIYWRQRPVESIIKEIESIYKLTENKDKKMYFVDLNFGGNKQIMRDLLSDISKAGLQIKFWTGVDVNLDSETLTHMKKTGCVYFYTGVETAHQEFVDNFAKSKLHDQEHIKTFFKNTKESGILPVASLVLMLPGETRKSLIETIEFCKQLIKIPIKNSYMNSKIIFYPNIFRPAPNTPICEALEKEGWEAPNSFLDWGIFYNEVSTGNFKRCNYAAGVTKIFLIYTLLKFVQFNLSAYLFPRFVNKISRISSHYFFKK